MAKAKPKRKTNSMTTTTKTTPIQLMKQSRVWTWLNALPAVWEVDDSSSSDKSGGISSDSDSGGTDTTDLDTTKKVNDQFSAEGKVTGDFSGIVADTSRSGLFRRGKKRGLDGGDFDLVRVEVGNGGIEIIDLTRDDETCDVVVGRPVKRIRRVRRI